MSVTVRTIMPNPIADEDKRIGWIDRPLIGDVVHEDGHYFETNGGDLMVFTKAENTIAIYPAGHWFGVVDSDPDSDEITEEN
jgi:hypothetical protein